MCASPKIQKTNAARLLDRARIAYELVPYKFDPEDLAAQHVAEELGEPIEQVYKTLVLHGDRTGHFVCVLAGNREWTSRKPPKPPATRRRR
jgi:Cys-tRNA(Pro)/Cys-tRNA(Cys) deacylase